MSAKVHKFRFQKNDIPFLAVALRIQAFLNFSLGILCSGIDGLCLLLKRLRYDMFSHFARPVPELSIIINQVLVYIYETDHQRIVQWNQTILRAHHTNICKGSGQ